jgi:hypothetical protein
MVGVLLVFRAWYSVFAVWCLDAADDIQTATKLNQKIRWLAIADHGIAPQKFENHFRERVAKMHYLLDHT